MARDWSVSATASERAHESGLPRRFAGYCLFDIAERFAVMDAPGSFPYF
jgi:hypothetical protein